MKKTESKWLQTAKVIGWPLRKAASAIYWALKKTSEAVFWALKKIYRMVSKTAIEKVQENKKPKTQASYLPFEIKNTVSGEFNKFESMLLNSKSSIGIILGARGTGKSALGMRIIENVKAKNNRPVAAMGFLNESLPSWIKAVEKIKEIQNNSFVLVDEGGIIFSSRESMSDANKVLGELLLIARHKDLSVLFISQNSANLDINAIRQSDYLLLRKSSLLQKDFERKKIQQVYEKAQPLFEEYGAEKQKITYIYSDEFEGLIENDLPSFWSEKASKAYKGFVPK
jgi:hypothetical protein